MRITIEGHDEEIREVMPEGWRPEIRIDIVLGGKKRVFVPVRLKEHFDRTNTLLLEELITIKTKQEIKAEEAVKAAEESLKKAREVWNEIKEKK